MRPPLPSAVRAVQPHGVSAALAETRGKLRDAVPADQWDAVMAEVTKIQVDQSASMLQAMQIVLRKVAAGWTPPRVS